ncbi:hypothetical protein BJ166DRAFT_68862 [Pestalotiopsis sp. NC0098]|nr:hypothetical protein BJ166DRAFT_68862 [Pestalotiopsis sp. NC0098]
MAHVYQGSYVTIAATSSSDSRGGLFLDISSPAIKVEGQINGEGREVACCVRHPVAARSDIWTSPLCQRAWVLQEQILSRRLVHFTKEQMFFQCHGRLEFEDGTISDTEFNSLRGSATSAEGETGMGIRDFDSPLQARKTWWSWVTEYSARSLTFRSDRMAAFAGIVKRYEDRMAQVPLLGLWKETIWYDLGWFVDVKHDEEQRAGDNESK